jgi:predicted metal-dependent hydrolase
MQPVRRDLDFQLPAERANDWNAEGIHTSTFYNTMSLFFPAGERFFIHAVRHYRDRIKDPALLEAVKGFIGQEAMHGREHEAYNEHVAASGVPVRRQEARVARFLEWLKAHRTPAEQLAATVALEHLTAILADMVLREPRLLAGAEPHYADLWRWHALEETEHKAVAYDVWVSVMGRSPGAYVLRVGAFVVANVIFWSLMTPYFLQNLRAQRQLGNWRGWLRFLKYAWVSPGALRRIIPAWFSYFRPGFHPWDHDNRRYLAGIDALAARYGALQAAA